MSLQDAATQTVPVYVLMMAIGLVSAFGSVIFSLLLYEIRTLRRSQHEIRNQLTGVIGGREFAHELASEIIRLTRSS